MRGEEIEKYLAKPWVGIAFPKSVSHIGSRDWLRCGVRGVLILQAIHSVVLEVDQTQTVSKNTGLGFEADSGVKRLKAQGFGDVGAI